MGTYANPDVHSETAELSETEDARNLKFGL